VIRKFELVVKTPLKIKEDFKVASYAKQNLLDLTPQLMMANKMINSSADDG